MLPWFVRIVLGRGGRARVLAAGILIGLWVAISRLLLVGLGINTLLLLANLGDAARTSWVIRSLLILGMLALITNWKLSEYGSKAAKLLNDVPASRRRARVAGGRIKDKAPSGDS